MAALCLIHSSRPGTVAGQSPLPLFQKSQSSPRTEPQAGLSPSTDRCRPVRPRGWGGEAPAGLNSTHVRSAQAGKGILPDGATAAPPGKRTRPATVVRFQAGETSRPSEGLVEGSDPGTPTLVGATPWPAFLPGPGARVPESAGLGTRCSRLRTGPGSTDTTGSPSRGLRTDVRVAACMWLRVRPLSLGSRLRLEHGGYERQEGLSLLS